MNMIRNKWALALALSLGLHVFTANAQTTSLPPLTISNTGTNAVDMEFRTDGTLIAKGNIYWGTLQSGDQGAGDRFLWFPAQSCLRAGSVDGTQWDASNIGTYSIGLGRDVKASGYASVAEGGYNTATGAYSSSFGFYNTSYGQGALSTGYLTNAYGNYSLASGASTAATGYASTALGLSTIGQAYLSLVGGTFNVGGGNPSAWIATDPLFELGNGTSSTAKSDALMVYKNGDAVFQGVVSVAAGGDIPMYGN